MIEILFPAFIISLVLLGIHSYFGIRIIQRGIIFTDLAIGQMAALGAAVALMFAGGSFVYPLSLGFAITGGLCIAHASRRVNNLEALIGLMYALGLSGVFILLSKSPHGMEQFQNLMAYDILFTRMKDIVHVAVLYGILGIVIFVFDKKTTGFVNDILFFLTFAATVTSSVKLAGVLVVFAILLGPACIALQISTVKGVRGIVGKHPVIAAWIIGIAVNLVSIIISYLLDLPTGYTLVFCHAFLAVTVTFAIHR